MSYPIETEMYYGNETNYQKIQRLLEKYDKEHDRY